MSGKRWIKFPIAKFLLKGSLAAPRVEMEWLIGICASKKFFSQTRDSIHSIQLKDQEVLLKETEAERRGRRRRRRGVGQNIERRSQQSQVIVIHCFSVPEGRQPPPSAVVLINSQMVRHRKWKESSFHFRCWIWVHVHLKCIIWMLRGRAAHIRSLPLNFNTSFDLAEYRFSHTYTFWDGFALASFGT